MGLIIGSGSRSGGSISDAVRYGTAQSLTDVQKAQARTNIGAASAEDVASAIIYGYLLNGVFYSDAGHTQAITAQTGKRYVDQTDPSDPKDYQYNGTAYVPFGNDKLDKATPTAEQGTKEYLYSFAGQTQNTDVALINDMSSEPEAYTDKMVPTAKSVATELAGKQDEITSSNKLNSSLVSMTVETTLPAALVAGRLYDLGVQTTLALGLPITGTPGDSIVIDFISGSTATTISFTSGAAMTKFSLVPKTNRIYRLTFNWARIDQSTYGWESAYEEYGVGGVLITDINPASETASLTQTGTTDVLEEYIAACKPYVLTADGSKMAEIASATFEGAYSGMTSGTVTFKDGTVKQITDLNTAGCNFMVYRPDLYVWCGEESEVEKLKFYGITNTPSCKHFAGKYIGMFKAYNQSNVLKSQPGRIPTGNATIASFQSWAKAGGSDYGLWNYSDWCRENAIHLAAFHNTNYESNVGVGRINNYSNVRNIVTGFTLPHISSPLKCGVKASPDAAGDSVNSLHFYGIEGMGEQIWEFVIGFRHDGAGNAVIWDENEWGESHTGRALTLPVTSASSSFIKQIIAGSDFDVMPKTVGGSSTTGMCDGHWIRSSGRLLFVGGLASVGSICGLSASYAYDGFGDAHDYHGARLAFYGSPTEVAGADLI